MYEKIQQFEIGFCLVYLILNICTCKPRIYMHYIRGMIAIFFRIVHVSIITRMGLASVIVVILAL